MSPWLQIVLFLHVFGAIIAFGPTFSYYPIAGMMSGKEPQHANFAARLGNRIADVRVTPLAALQGITGLLLIFITGINPFAQLWLGIAIVLYLIAFGYALFVQKPVGHRIAELTASPPPPAATGPSPELMAAVKRAQQGGIILAVLIAVIVFLMVTKLSF